MSLKERFENFMNLYRIAPTNAKFNFLLGLSLVTILIVFIIFGDFIVPYNPLELTDNNLGPPTWENIMGTDHLGRDLFSRMVSGTKFSLGTSFLATT